MFFENCITKRTGCKDTYLEEHKETVRRNRMARSGFWKWTTLLLFIILLVGVYVNGFPSVGNKEKTAEKAIAFLNENLLSGFATASIKTIEEKGDLYILDIELVSNLSEQVQNATIYVTKDGNLLFPSAIDLSDFVSAANEEGSIDIVSFTAAEDPMLGNPDAVLTIVEYADFECPACGEAYWIVQDILEKYPEDVKLVFKNFPLEKHDSAQKAAEAAECAHLQGSFEAYYDLLFQNQNDLAVDDLKGYAEDLGLDMNSFEACLDSDAMEEEVALDFAEGIEVGVRGTPSFFIGKQKLEGGDAANFERIIEEELAKLSESTE